MEFAKHQALLNAPVAGSKDSTPYRDHLEAAAKKSARARAELEGPPFPESLSYLWTWATELHGRSGVGQFGASPLGYGTIADWSRLTNTNTRPHEVEALLMLDGAMFYFPKTKAEEG